MRVFEKKFLFNLAKIKIDAHEACIRILMLKFRWPLGLFEKGACVGGGVDPYAFIRVHNERPTLKCSLNSILPAITKGIIGYHDCTDGSEEIILDFCKENPGFIPAKYDFFNRYPLESHAEKLTRYYNYVLSLMPRNEWLIKIDADQIYDAEKLKTAFLLIKTTKDVVILPRIGLHYQDGDLYVFSKRNFNFAYDHWIIFNDGNLYFDVWHIYECLKILDDFQRKTHVAEVVSWHYPRMKTGRNNQIEPSSLMQIDEWMQNWSGKIIDTLTNTCYPDEMFDRKMLNKDILMNHVKQFDFSSIQASAERIQD